MAHSDTARHGVSQEPHVLAECSTDLDQAMKMSMKGDGSSLKH